MATYNEKRKQSTETKPAFLEALAAYEVPEPPEDFANRLVSLNEEFALMQGVERPMSWGMSLLVYLRLWWKSRFLRTTAWGFVVCSCLWMVSDTFPLQQRSSVDRERAQKSVFAQRHKKARPRPMRRSKPVPHRFAKGQEWKQALPLARDTMPTLPSFPLTSKAQAVVQVAGLSTAKLPCDGSSLQESCVASEHTPLGLAVPLPGSPTSDHGDDEPQGSPQAVTAHMMQADFASQAGR